MPQGTRPARVGEELRQALAELLAREVHDPGVGFVTITHVKVSPGPSRRPACPIPPSGTTRCDGDDRRCGRSAAPATPFLRRAIGQRLRLRRVPELMFHFDESVENQARIERILIDLADERNRRAAGEPGDAETPETETGPAPPVKEPS